VEQCSNLPQFRISSTLVDEWAESRMKPEAHDRRCYLRIGQDFYNYFNLHKMKNEENAWFCDRLHAADGHQAVNLIASIIDYQN
jgi:hypothetical protein